MHLIGRSYFDTPYKCQLCERIDSKPLDSRCYYVYLKDLNERIRTILEIKFSKEIFEYINECEEFREDKKEICFLLCNKCSNYIYCNKCSRKIK